MSNNVVPGSPERSLGQVIMGLGLRIPHLMNDARQIRGADGRIDRVELSYAELMELSLEIRDLAALVMTAELRRGPGFRRRVCEFINKESQ